MTMPKLIAMMASLVQEGGVEVKSGSGTADAVTDSTGAAGLVEIDSILSNSKKSGRYNSTIENGILLIDKREVQDEENTAPYLYRKLRHT